jgi:hypothetical protein
MLRRRFAVTLLGLALVAGCSSTEHTPEKTPAEALAAARASLAKATSVHLVLASTEVPAGPNDRGEVRGHDHRHGQRSHRQHRDHLCR